MEVLEIFKSLKNIKNLKLNQIKSNSLYFVLYRNKKRESLEINLGKQKMPPNTRWESFMPGLGAAGVGRSG